MKKLDPKKLKALVKEQSRPPFAPKFKAKPAPAEAEGGDDDESEEDEPEVDVDEIKKQIEDILATSTSRDRAIKAIENLVNDKLSINGINALPTSYFDNLATHQIVRSRNIGSIYQASSVGSKSYTLINPRDTRTSPVCLAVTNGQVFHMADALSVAEGLIGARTMQDLRSVQPFARQGSDIGKGPVPPLHWPKCRTWMNWIFAGLG